MLIVTVRFAVKPAFREAFYARVKKQAEDTLTLEAHCHRFDIATAVGNPELIFLYEIYADEAAFQSHLASTHFLSFKADTQGWTDSADVERWDGPWA
jgi:quinol monooxygenase YgiN